MHTAPPIKNLFLTLYLLNNTINENLLWDRYNQREQLDDDLDMKTQTSEEKQNAESFPILQIPKSWDCLSYKGSGQDSGWVKKCQGPSWMHKQRFPYRGIRGKNTSFSPKENGAKKTVQRKISVDLQKPLTSESSLTTSEPEHGENHGSNCFHNETIINQTNFFIILPESTRFSHRQNYSKSLSEIAKGGKGALDNLTNIMKSKTNKITTVKSTNEEEVQDIPNKLLDQILKNTPNLTFILREETAPVILPINSTDNVDRYTTLSSHLEKTSTAIDLSSLLTLLIHESSTASRIKNISDTYTKAVGKKASTTLKLQTQKIKIPSSPAATADNTNCWTPHTEIAQQTCSITSKNSNNLTASFLEFLKKHNKTQSTNFTINLSQIKNQIDFSISKTSCVPENKGSSSTKVIFLNNSRNQTEIEKNRTASEENSFSQLTTIPPIVQDYNTKLSTGTQKITTTVQTTVPKKKATSRATVICSSTIVTSTVTRMNKTKSTKKTTTTTIPTTPKLSNDALKTESLSLKNVSQEKENITGTGKVTTTEYDNYCSEFDDHTTHSTCLPFSEEYHEEEDKMPLEEEVDDERSDSSQHRSCRHNSSTTIPKTCGAPEKHTTPKITICTRRQKSTTQMLPQKIFSPTMMIHGGKQKNGSVLVIKLISETSEKPFDLEHYIRMITFRKLNHKLRPNKKSIKTNINTF